MRVSENYRLDVAKLLHANRRMQKWLQVGKQLQQFFVASANTQFMKLLRDGDAQL